MRDRRRPQRELEIRDEDDSQQGGDEESAERVQQVEAAQAPHQAPSLSRDDDLTE